MELDHERFSCRRHVESKIFELTGDHDVASMSPASRAMLAQLRVAGMKPQGSVPAIWGLTLDGIPDSLPPRQRARAESAIHIAMTLFAQHQQGKARRMHIKDTSFSEAVRRLAQSGAGEKSVQDTPVYKRFSSFVQAQTDRGIQAHARGLVAQLRGEDLGFDYGRFAEDLYWFLLPASRKKVQQQWGRDFYRVGNPATSPEPTAEEGV